MGNLDPARIVPKLDLIVLDCPDALELGQFYSRLLSWQLHLDFSVEDIDEAGPSELSLTLSFRGGLQPR